METQPHEQPPIESLEAEKIRLEIKELRRKLSWRGLFGSIGSVIASLILVGGFLGGIYQYNDSKKEEFKRRFWEKQLATYSAVASSAARLATVSSDSARDAEFDRFWQLYNGDFALIADSSAVIAAREYLQRYTDYTADPRRQERTQRASRAMARTFRDALTTSGDFPLPPVAPERK